MQVLKWLVAIGLLLVGGFFVYQWSIGASTEEMPRAADVEPALAVPDEQSEGLESPPSSANNERKSEAEIGSNAPATGAAAGTVNPFINPPEGSSGQAENADVANESQEPAPETEKSQATTRDLLKEVPDSYPIENAEAYYVPPEERYPGNLGGPPPLKLPPINIPESAGEGGQPSGGLAPSAPF